MEDHSSPGVKPNTITYDISGNGQASGGEIDYGQEGGEIDYGQEAVTEWVQSTKNVFTKQQ